MGRPTRADGLQLRTVLSSALPAEQRLAVLAVVVLFAGAGGATTGATDDPAFLALAIGAACLIAAALNRWFLTRKRRAHGLVKMTPLQFDLLIALSQLPADRIDAGRHLHDRLVWLLQQPTRDPAAVQQCEHWMWQLASGR